MCILTCLKICNLVTKSGFLLQKVTKFIEKGKKQAKSYKKLQKNYRFIFGNYLIYYLLQKLQKLQGFFAISEKQIFFQYTNNNLSI